MANLIGVFAGFERDVIRERVRAGIQNAKSKGIRVGRRPLIEQSGLRENGITQMSLEGAGKSELGKEKCGLKPKTETRSKPAVAQVRPRRVGDRDRWNTRLVFSGWSSTCANGA